VVVVVVVVGIDKISFIQLQTFDKKPGSPVRNVDCRSRHVSVTKRST
jgi:hypothetical protein